MEGLSIIAGVAIIGVVICGYYYFPGLLLLITAIGATIYILILSYYIFLNPTIKGIQKSKEILKLIVVVWGSIVIWYAIFVPNALDTWLKW